MRLQESGEMYLETILILSRKSNAVRSIDISEYMGYSKPSVSRAMGLLKAEGYISVDGGYITLTESGRTACFIDKGNDDSENNEEYENTGGSGNGRNNAIAYNRVNRMKGVKLGIKKTSGYNSHEQRGISLLGDECQSDSDYGRE